MDTLGIRIKTRLKQIQKTQDWLAEQLGLSSNGVSKWITGKSDPSLDNLRQIMKALDCPASYLLDEHTGPRADLMRVIDSWDNDKVEALTKFASTMNNTKLSRREHAPDRITLTRQVGDKKQHQG